MAPSDNQALNDELLRRYLLGALPEAETERLDELSVTDEEFGGRLDAVENDLVDAYVRGELPQEYLEQFKSSYLSSPKRRQKAQFAEGFLALEHRTAGAGAGMQKASGEPSPSEPALPNGSVRRMAVVPRLRFQWGLAAACLALLVAGGYLLFQNLELRKQLSEAQSQHGNQRAGDLEMQLAQAQAAEENARKELEQARASQLKLDRLRTVAVLLPPPMRGANAIPKVRVSPGTDLVVLVLPLETDDFPAYQAKLKDPRTNRIVWSSPVLTIAQGGERRSVSISFRSGLLKQQNYIVDLMGMPSHGANEVIGGYPFTVVLQ
jgi:hypothetical protein